MEIIEESEIPKVIQNSDCLYKSDVKWFFDGTYIEPNEYEKNLLKNTKTPQQLIEEENEEMKKHDKEMTEEDKLKEKKKNLITMFRVIAANRMNLHPLVNVSNLQPDQRKTLIGIMECLVMDYKNNLECDICSEFNDICNNKLLQPGADVSTYPVY